MILQTSRSTGIKSDLPIMSMTLKANWSYPTAIRFGVGRVAELAAACAEAGITRPLLVTDRTLRETPMIRLALELLNNADTPVFADVDSNPTDNNLAAGVRAFEEGDCDGVIAFGGGSSLDLGKLVAFMVRQTRPVWDFEDIGDFWKRADAAAIFPIVAVPTTAGTGSEVGRAGVLTDSQRAVKKIIFHPRILPAAVICDPSLTVGLPPFFTAGTGMDAFAHCLEAYSSPAYHPMSQGIALEGMRLVKENLPHAFTNGDALEARANMMSAALMGAVAFQKGLGGAHALTHSVGAMYNTHHGMTCAVVLPAVLRFNRPAIESRIAAAADYLGIGGGFDGFYEYLLLLRQTLKVPQKLRDLGACDERMDKLIANAVSDLAAAGNPITLTPEAVKQLFAECL